MGGRQAILNNMEAKDPHRWIRPPKWHITGAIELEAITPRFESSDQLVLIEYPPTELSSSKPLYTTTNSLPLFAKQTNKLLPIIVATQINLLKSMGTTRIALKPEKEPAI